MARDLPPYPQETRWELTEYTFSNRSEGNIFFFSKEEANKNGWQQNSVSYYDTRPELYKINMSFVLPLTCPYCRFTEEQDVSPAPGLPQVSSERIPGDVG